MVQLSDLLSSSAKQKLLNDVGRGDIIKLELTLAEGVIPKHAGETKRNKYFVILGKTTDGKLLGFVLINSNVNTNININLQKAHYPISAKRYTFLQHDSYVYCGQIKEISMEIFAERYKCQSFGKLEQDDLEKYYARGQELGKYTSKGAQEVWTEPIAVISRLKLKEYEARITKKLMID